MQWARIQHSSAMEQLQSCMTVQTTVRDGLLFITNLSSLVSTFSTHQCHCSRSHDNYLQHHTAYHSLPLRHYKQNCVNGNANYGAVKINLSVVSAITIPVCRNIASDWSAVNTLYSVKITLKVMVSDRSHLLTMKNYACIRKYWPVWETLQHFALIRM